MAKGWYFPDGYVPNALGVCLPGDTAQIACTDNGGSYWDFSGSGAWVCSFGSTTKDAINLVSVPECPGVGGELMPPLSYASASSLLAALFTVWGVAYMFRLLLRQLYNR